MLPSTLLPPVSVDGANATPAVPPQMDRNGPEQASSPTSGSIPAEFGSPLLEDFP